MEESYNMANQAELTEEQLLLLNNLMYCDKIFEYAPCTVEDLIKVIKVTIADYDEQSFSLSGGFETNTDGMENIIAAIESDPQLLSLTIKDTVNTSEGACAACFVDANDNATIAVRGTGGGYDAWADNFDGLNDPNTTSQEQILDFVREQSESHGYDDITITGHSKGGNLAQYATILEGDSIDRCVSFDGQGFNDEFCEIYQDEISANADKIKSICGDQDYVNILLNEVAGETVYLETSKNGFDAHSSYYLWEQNHGKTNSNGEFSATVDQHPIFQAADKFVDSFADIVNDMPDFYENAFVDALGSFVAVLMSLISGRITPDNLKNSLWDLFKLHISNSLLSLIDPYSFSKLYAIFKEFIDCIFDYLNDANSSDNDKSQKSKVINVGSEVAGNYIIDVNLNSLRNYEKELHDCKNKIHSLNFELLAVNALTNYAGDLDSTVKKIRQNLATQKESLDALEDSLDKIINLYKQTEDSMNVF